MTARIDAKALHDACRRGTAQEREQAFEQLRGILYRIACSQAQRHPELHDLAEECTQDAMLAIWQTLKAGRGPDRPESFVSWAASITVHKLRDALRRRPPQLEQTSPHPIDSDPQDPGPSIVERKAAPEASRPEEVVIHAELCRLLINVRSLPNVSTDSKEVLLKGFLLDWNDEELAQALKTSTPNVHTIRCRDLMKVRDNADFMAKLKLFCL